MLVNTQKGQSIKFLSPTHTTPCIQKLISQAISILFLQFYVLRNINVDKNPKQLLKKKKGNQCDALPSTLVSTGPVLNVLNVSGQIRQISTEPSCRHQSGGGAPAQLAQGPPAPAAAPSFCLEPHCD